VLFTPTPTRSLQGYTSTRTHLLLNVSEHVTSQLEEWSFGAHAAAHAGSGAFARHADRGGLHDPQLAKDALAEDYLVNYADFLTPDTLFLAHAGSDAREVLKARTAQFDATGMRAEQRSPPARTARRCPTSWSGPRAPRPMAQPDPAVRLRRLRGLAAALVFGRLGKAWYSAAACWSWPICAAAASTARPGTRPR
jgi:prolyl oligopeptidase